VLFLRPPGGTFRKAAVIADTGAVPRVKRLGGATLAVNDAGDVLLVWDQDRRVLARIITARGRLGPVQRLGREVVSFAFKAAALGPGRQALVAWQSQWVIEGSTATPSVVSLAVAPRGGRFSDATVVESVAKREQYVEAPSLDMAITGERRGLLVWTGADGGGYVIRAATIAADGIKASQTLSPAGVEAQRPSLATGPSGRAIVAWHDGFNALGVNVAEDGAPFGPPTTLATGTDPSSFIGASVVAVDPMSGRAHALWSQGSDVWHATLEPGNQP